jgi:AGZA family xanthine/uracil permease-like MFS transporter
MAYIIAVNVSRASSEMQSGLRMRFGLPGFPSQARILSQTGGTCPCDETNRLLCDNILDYRTCKEGKKQRAGIVEPAELDRKTLTLVVDVRRDLITATAAVAGFSSFIFGFLTNLPVALAYVCPPVFFRAVAGICLLTQASPGMGLNAYFAFQVVGVNGTGAIPYKLALTAVFVEGLVFIFLALTGMRQWLVKLIPATIKTATGVGIGLFLTEIGLSYSAGIGAISGGGSATPLALAGCRHEDVDIDTGMCHGALMSNPKVASTITVDSSNHGAILTCPIAVGWRAWWRHLHGLLDGVPRQVCSGGWHRVCVDTLVAVSCSSPRVSRSTN